MKALFYKLFEHQNLTQEESRLLLHDIAEGKYNDAQIASLITVFLMRSISVEELSGFREALMELRHPVSLSDYNPIDIVGTGGDGKNTFNISTCACFVVAGAGYPVVKHGNYGATSISGASNVMEHHGVRFTSDNDSLRKSLDVSNFAFLHAPLFNPALKTVAPTRRALGVRSFFNMLGPLVNPAMPTYQLLGVYNLPLQRLYSYTFQSAGARFAVVHSLDGYDEISLTSDFKVMTPHSEKIYTPESLGLLRCEEEHLSGGETIESASLIFDHVLQNNASRAQTECVVANAAFAIRVICPEKSIEECIGEATVSIRSGKAFNSFKRFLSVNS